MKREIIFASGNVHKLEEIRSIFGKEWKVYLAKEKGFSEKIIEDGSSFRENALIKAKAVFKSFGEMVLSEDSGLCVEALNDAPGIHSARYAGENASSIDHINMLLEAMKNFDNRKAHFISCFCLFDGNETHYFEGYCHGRISKRILGVRGFGYDPIFIPSSSDLSFAEMGVERKNEMSHRRMALNHLMTFLRE